MKINIDLTTRELRALDQVLDRLTESGNVYTALSLLGLEQSIGRQIMNVSGKVDAKVEALDEAEERLG